MKTKVYIPAVLFAASILINSCSKDETSPDPATIIFEPDSADTFTGIAGDIWTFQITAKAPGGFESFEIQKTIDSGTPVTLVTYPDDNGDNEVVVDFSDTLQLDNVGKKVTLSFILTEKGTTGITVTKTEITNSPPARKYTAILLYAPQGNNKTHSFFSTSKGFTYTPDSVVSAVDTISRDIDFGYYYGNTDQASLASPKGFTNTEFFRQVDYWGMLNGITFKTTDITKSLYDNILTYADIDNAYNADTGLDTKDIVTHLTQGQIIAFETDPEKPNGIARGLIFVDEIKGTFNEGDYIKLDVLAQEPVH